MPFAGIFWTNGSCGLRMRLAGEAEASSAGEQLAEDYPVGTHRTDGTAGGVMAPPAAGHDASGR